ncbi:MAG: serine/threonine protein kinase [Bifidobacteriaceae bacterium]|jgi:hypothetical protein|nr:serine/threonine protein kinase [Bifidobacteriaceae bacterium]
MMDMDLDRLCLGCFREVATRPCPHCGFDPAVPSSFTLALPPGEILAGRYLVGKPLGQGGFGITYLAFDLTLQVKVAVKEYMPAGLISRDQDRTSVVLLSSQHEADFQANKQKFLDEARILAQLSDAPNIAKVQNFFLENNTAYFTMEYVDGMSLKDLVANAGGRLGFDQVARFLEPIAAALEQVHARALLHRDISPDNVYVTSTGQSKLLDFGAARFALGDERSLSVILKHGFAPEEQYRTHGRQGPWTDLYALAATFYYCLTGSRPPDAIDRLHQDTLAPPSALGVALPAYAEAALMRALAVRADDRYQSMGQFVAALAGRSVETGTGPTAWAGGPGMSGPVTGVATGPTDVLGHGGAGAGPGGPGGPLGPGRPEPFGGSSSGDGKASLWKRLTGSRGALIATGAAAAVLLVGIVVGVTLAVSGGGKHNAVGGGNPPVSLPAVSPETEAPPTPTPDPTEPTPEPPTPDLPDNWYHSDALGLGFEVPSGWTPGEDTDGISLISPDESSFAVVVYDSTMDVATLIANMDAQMEDIAVNMGSSNWEYIASEYRSDLGDQLWYEVSFAVYDETDTLYPVQLYAADAVQGGTYTLCFVSSPPTGANDFADIDAVLTSLTPDAA